ncbi:MAG: threonylcarbamoyl-AMP synthase [Bacteroidales bacterium]|jgi:L-threonylcarbamoyladenylate synthase|nr:threonylcarbamoyl-AMP synthase [Bacteroidales bacterium]
MYEINHIEISNCIKVLRNGGTLLYLTDTIWGIGCDATQEKAVNRVYRIKRRDLDRSFIVLVADEQQLADYVENVPPVAYDLIKAVDKPLTIVYPEGKNVAPNIMGDDGSIAIRIVKNEFCKELIRSFGKPIISTSANISGENNPTTFSSISPLIISEVDHIVVQPDNPFMEIKQSRIIKIEKNGMFTILRD